ncbi:amidase signature domain-containing protein [Coniochaeta sp. 2T2.1]|nr:amidase signature domain-containing protein [Coniochaeta sp. 2T2.1]
MSPSRSLRSLCSLALSLLAAAPSAAQLVSTGLSVTLDNVNYFISPYTAGKLPDASASVVLTKVPSVMGFQPVSVIQQAVAKSDISALLANWTALDDVYTSAFSQAIFLAGASCISKRAVDGGASSLVLPFNNTQIPSGPYFLETATGSLYPVYWLYEDFAGAFTEGLLQTPEGDFQTLSAQIPGSASLTVGVPSRLYYTKTAAKPLAGVRIGVKDIYALAGTKQSNGNRAWYNLYPKNNVTAVAIQNLIDAGAVITGLQKPSQFANGETATADWVDYHSPFNPRGDGYQDPSSSSSGAGASIASYDWLDVAVGSDTGGSIRGPAGMQGIFGNRPSHNLVSLDNVMALSPTLDTAGFLLRDVTLWDAVCAAMYKEKYTSLAAVKPNYPKTIYTLSFPTTANNAANTLLINFLNSLQEFVGATTSTPITLANEFQTSKPAEAGTATLSQFLNTTYATLISKEQIAIIRDPFYRDYGAAHDGRLPFVDPAPLARWAYGDSLPASALDEAKRQKTVFMDWFNSKFLVPVSDPAQCSSGLMLYVASTGNGNSLRNRYISAPTPPFGFSSGRISVLAEVPDHVFPVGQVPQRSSVTNHDEYFPVAIDILAAKGCDGMLIRLAKDLSDAGLLPSPKTGATINGGDILVKKRAEAMGIKEVRYVG